MAQVCLSLLAAYVLIPGILSAFNRVVLDATHPGCQERQTNFTIERNHHKGGAFSGPISIEYMTSML